MKNYEALKILENLNKIKNSKIEYPIKVGFRLYQNIQNFTKSLETYNLMRNDIIKKYSTDGKTSIGADDEHFEDALSELRELDQQEIGDVDISYVKLSDLEKINIPMDEIMCLSIMIKEDET